MAKGGIWDTAKPRPASRSLKAVYEKAAASAPWSSGVGAASLMARPSGCICTWTPLWEGEPGAYQTTGGFALKFRNTFCPYLRHSRPAS